MRRNTSGRRVAWLLAFAAPIAMGAQYAKTYLEFGTVVVIGRTTVEVQMMDPRLGHPVQRSFQLGRDTQADLVHVGDNVELIYAPGQHGEWMLERLIALHGELPTIGPPPTRAAVATTATAVNAPATAQPGSPGSPVATVPKKSRPSVGRGSSARNASAAAKPAPSPAVPPAAPAPVTTVKLPTAADPQVPAVRRVPLGGAYGAVNPAAPKLTAVAAQPVGEVCNRTAQWPAQPISLAVLDFRYPTEKEEARDLAQVGGGSGTALADHVYDLLAEDPHLALSRGDREKVFRMDFAGAARLGRQLGVDAVMLGTFVPVEVPNADPEFPPPTQAYTLRAGIVETCTGELLYKLQSVTCAASATGTCPGSEVSAKAASNPSGNSAAFAEPLRNLLAPVLDDGPPAGMRGDAGAVTEVHGSAVTLRINPGARLRAGDQVGIHAFRLAKIPSTNTLHVYRNELIGRVTVQRVSGGYAYGTFAGEPAPLPGDLADLLTE